MLRAIRVEFLKLKRSWVPLWTAVVVLVWPMWTMMIARLGDTWEATNFKAYLQLGPQEIASWYGVLLGGFIAAYVFGRESTEGTVHHRLALPVRREWFVVSKLLVLLLWVFALSAISVIAHVGYAAVFGLHGFAWTTIADVLGVTMKLTVVMAAPLSFVGWLAVVGRGYFAPMIFSAMAFASSALFLQVGWVRWFPWSMPFGLVDMMWLPTAAKATLVPASWAILAVLFTAGVTALIVQIDYADCLE